MFFKNRQEAGKKLAKALAKYQYKDVVVFGLPRGGVVLAIEVARFLAAPLDLIIPRKIGHPQNPEYAVCAVAEHGDDVICNEDERKALGEEWIKQAAAQERAEAKRRRAIYLAGKKPLSLAGKTAIIIDDGIATGLTMRAAIQDAKARKPAKIVVAIPVIPRDTAKVIAAEVDELVALDKPLIYLGAVGAYYAEFPQVSDEEVIKMMAAL